MIPDGYDDESMLQRVLEMNELCDKQVELTKELVSTSHELNTLPPMPKDLDKWIGSIPDGKSEFKLAHFGRLFKIGRKYDKLVEESKENMQKIKLVMIDELLDKIKSVIGK